MKIEAVDSIPTAMRSSRFAELHQAVKSLKIDGCLKIDFSDHTEAYRALQSARMFAKKLDMRLTTSLAKESATGFLMRVK